MKRIVLRVRPAEVMDDLNLEMVRGRVALLVNWDIEVQDTRLSDAPYVTVVVKVRSVDPEATAQLKGAFSNLPRMSTQVWSRSRPEVPLDLADVATLEEAAEPID